MISSIKIGLASSNTIRSWSHGEVKKPETINYRTLKPEREGLFCEKIFGPSKDWECNCGKYKGIRYKGIVCEKCGVEVTKAKVRRERMGHIELASPVSHIWYFKGIPSRMGLLLDMRPKDLEEVLYFASFIVTDINAENTGLQLKQLLSDMEYRQLKAEYGDDFNAMMGAEAIEYLLQTMDLEQESEDLRVELEDARGQRRRRVTRRLEVVEAFLNSDNHPEDMILDVIPVIPPDLRPMVQLDGGRFAAADLNDLYRRVINRNNRLKDLLDMQAPDIIVRNEKRMLQESVDSLIDNGRRGRPVTGPGNRQLKSLSEMLKGKQGRFRQNLLGKRVDYSGRSVIVSGPELKFHQCGLPKDMALELFKPYVMKGLVDADLVYNIKSAKRMVEKKDPKVWDILDEVIKDQTVLLNRAPTLHRLGIQAFEPVLVEGKAIKLHPLACPAYNADFDGDQMAVHLPLSPEAQAEARLLMLSTNNVLGLKDGKPISTPTQDMILGIYYLTMEIPGGTEIDGMVFSSINHMLQAYEQRIIDEHTKVSVRMNGVDEDGELISEMIKSTVGRFIFNQHIKQNLGFVDRTENPLDLEINETVDKGLLGRIIDRTFELYGNMETVKFLDDMKDIGFKYATISGVSISAADVEVPSQKPGIISEARKEVRKYETAYRRGLISDEERYEKVIGIWGDATETITNKVMDGFDPNNDIFLMADSGARGSKNQISQLAGMRGLMVSPVGDVIEVPITANFKEGLTVIEFFMSTHGSRKGLADTALRTADSGYLTRRLVDVAQEVIIKEEDCGTDEYTLARKFSDGAEIIETLHDRILGRYAVKDVVSPGTGEIIIHAGDRITGVQAEQVEAAGIEEVAIRTALHCKTKGGICSKCYGMNLANGGEVGIGEAVGIIAAQSIGEPGTQLTMRTFHEGGVASGYDITQGLPRVEELFEARRPKGLAVITEIPGTVTVEQKDRQREVVVTNNELTERYSIPYGANLLVKDDMEVEAGDPLTAGSIYPQDLLKVLGEAGVQNYILKEVQRVYRLQGVDIDDKYVEVIVRQMLSNIKIEESGDTDLLPGSYVNRLIFDDVNEEAIANGKEPAVGSAELMGITKASLETESFLSAASFQETTRVLTDAAIKGKEDHLEGLKENVIIGQLIPAGTGLRQFTDVQIKHAHPIEEQIEETTEEISV